MVGSVLRQLFNALCAKAVGYQEYNLVGRKNWSTFLADHVPELTLHV